MKRKTILALVLVLALLGSLVPVGAASDQWPPEDSAGWVNVDRSTATGLIQGMLRDTLEEDTVLVYFSENCGYSRRYVPEFVEYAESLGLTLYGYNQMAGGTLNAFWSLPDVADIITWPCVAVYRAGTGTVVAQDYVEGKLGLEALLTQAGLLGSETESEPEAGGDPVKEERVKEEPTVKVADPKPLTAATASNNLNRQNYSRWASTVKSYLYANDRGGVTRVEYVDGKVIAENYDSDLHFQNGLELPMELPLWGGFFAGAEYNFLMFGQSNHEEDNDQEVIRVVKYSKDWKRLGHTSLRGANTTVPFDAGSLRCAEAGGMLYIRTCHEMYTSRDGFNHQANLTMAVRQGDMTLTNSQYVVLNSSFGYVSHSFNQFVLADGEGNLVTLDHGDAYPRSLVVMRYKGAAGGNRFGSQIDDIDEIVIFPGSTGDNTTGARVGGFAETETGYVTAFSYDGNGGQGSGDPKEICLGYTDKEDFSSAYTVIPDSAEAATPVLAPTGTEGGYVLWNKYSGYRVDSDTLYYAPYTADGEAGAVQTGRAPLSDCQPILYRGKVLWYVTDGGEPTFYTLDQNGVERQGTVQIQDATLSDWARGEVEAAVTAGLVPEDLQNSYNRKITRLEFCRLAIRLVETVEEENWSDVDGSWMPFEDVSHPAVTGAYYLGIVKGTSDTTFNPGGAITRQEAATMLMRTAKELQIRAGSGAAFRDAPQFPDWASEGIAFVSGVTAGPGGRYVMQGDDLGFFNPTGTYTREQAYLTIYRLFQAANG